MRADQFTSVGGAQNDFMEVILLELPEQIFQKRPIPDLNHRFIAAGHESAQSRSQAANKDYGLHDRKPSSFL
jgi:hypothetical protein